MQRDRWAEIARVLDVALDHDPGQWPTILAAHCGGDTELRAEIEALLVHYTSAPRFLEAPPALAADALLAETVERAPRTDMRVGAYKLVQLIGAGGSGRVFLAERDDGQFAQRVAIKFLHAGRDSELDQRSFRSERQILASLQHPNIAQLFDGGITADGRPYLVMELVEGQPIDKYQAHQLTPRSQLELFLNVLNATQYAHLNLVVHRDLKPSNILVTNDGRVVLLDFGLAKLLEPRSSNSATVRTIQRWMTPEYAAPEQVLGEPTTTLTDIYQLGAVLYELLTGVTPFGNRYSGRFELSTAVLQDDPPAPSSHRRELRGDVDAIVLKALRKEPTQRYTSAQAFGDDIRRHLSGHPVLARRQSVAYSARRFVRRHPLALVAPAALIISISAYTAAVGVQRARVERAVARATTEARTASQVTALMLALFEASERGRAFTDTVSARDLLQRGAARASEITGEPLARAQLFDLIGQIAVQIGDDAQAASAFQEAIAIRQRELGPSHPITLGTKSKLRAAGRAASSGR